MIIDGNNLILGRLGTVVAKKALLGEEVVITNCDSIMITGKKDKILSEYKRRRDMGATKGPYVYRQPDMFVKRSIRGMFPYKKPKGREAFERVKCYRGMPDEYKDKAETIENASISKLDNLNYTKVKDICKFLGGKV